MGIFQDKIMSLCKTNATKNCNKPILVRNMYGDGKKPRKPKIKNN